VERLASFGRALEVPINITQDNIDEVQSDEGFPSVSLEALLPAKVKMLELLNSQGNPSKGLLYFFNMDTIS